ncbi:MAG: hypothetical protein U0I51_11225 [Muricomes sp.]|nr:hypothetical protein [Muricomes sp.]
MTRRGRLMAGQCLLVKCLTLREEAVEENGAEREVRAALGPNADAFAPQAAPEFAW